MGEWIATSAFRCDDLSELTESIRACLSRFDVGAETVPRSEHFEDHDALIYAADYGWSKRSAPLAEGPAAVLPSRRRPATTVA